MASVGAKIRWKVSPEQLSRGLDTYVKELLSAALAYSTVIFSSLFGALLWGEVLDASAWLAIGLIVASGIAATHFSRASPGEQD
jgi:threonine/homoserine efflux transporter RhtA